MRWDQKPIGPFPKTHPFWWHHSSLREPVKYYLADFFPVKAVEYPSNLPFDMNMNTWYPLEVPLDPVDPLDPPPFGHFNITLGPLGPSSAPVLPYKSSSLAVDTMGPLARHLL